MARIAVTDSENGIVLTEGYISEPETLARVYPTGHRLFYRDASLMPEDQEHAQAWMLTAYAQRIAQWRRHPPDSIQKMETWILNRPTTPGSMFESWFEGIAEDNYRLIIHRCPIEKHTVWPGTAWRRVYNRLSIRHRTQPWAHLKAPAKEFLRTFSQALSDRRARAS